MMTALIIVGAIASSIIFISAASYAAFRRYKYMRPKTRDVKIIFSSTGALVAFVLIGTFTLLPKGCMHPQPVASSGPPKCVQGSIAIDGSTALQPLVQLVANDYASTCTTTHITVSGGGSQTGQDDVENGTVVIGDSDTFAASTLSDLVDHQVAVVIYTVIVNKATQVTTLTTSQLKGIFSGQYSNWSQVGGANLKIITISRKTGSGTRATFDTYVLQGGSEKPTQSLADDTSSVIKAVQKKRGAIGYASLYDVENNSSNLTQVSIDGNPPATTLVENNTYKFWNIEHMYTKGAGSNLAQGFISYMGNSHAKQIFEANSFVAINDMVSDALATHCS